MTSYRYLHSLERLKILAALNDGVTHTVGSKRTANILNLNFNETEPQYRLLNRPLYRTERHKIYFKQNIKHIKYLIFKSEKPFLLNWSSAHTANKLCHILYGNKT